MKPKKNSKQLEITRIFDAPVKYVWEAWTDIDQVSKWWGPRGFSITTQSKDLRPGGKWIYTMHGPDGVDYPNITTYFAVEKYSRLEYDHGANENQKALFRVNVLFSETDGKTTMKMTMTFESHEAAVEIGRFIKQASGNSTWDRLGEYIDHSYNKKEVFLLNRVFSAPIQKVFEMFIDPEQIVKWQPPTGFFMKILEGDIKKGKNLFYEMGNGDVSFYGRSSYEEITPPYFISFHQEFCSKDGTNAKHPGASVWPARWLTSVTFADEGDGVTRLTLKSQIVDTHTSEELEAFISERGGMTIGWTGSLDRLEDLLE